MCDGLDVYKASDNGVCSRNGSCDYLLTRAGVRDKEGQAGPVYRGAEEAGVSTGVHAGASDACAIGAMQLGELAGQQTGRA
jgi:hypothetical protein